MLNNRRAEMDVWKMIAGIALVLVLLFIILYFVSDTVRGSINDLAGFKPNENTIGAAKCDTACDMAKQQVKDCTSPSPEWQNQYCIVKYNDTLTCSAAANKGVISKCTYSTAEGVDCSCA